MARVPMTSSCRLSPPCAPPDAARLCCLFMRQLGHRLDLCWSGGQVGRGDGTIFELLGGIHGRFTRTPAEYRRELLGALLALSRYAPSRVSPSMPCGERYRPAHLRTARPRKPRNACVNP